MGDVLGVFRVIREESVNFLIFVIVNLFFGGMALWLPPLLAAQHQTEGAAHQFGHVLEIGHGYLFALALLAAACSYMVREYRENTKSEFKDLKLSATSIAFALMLLMAVCLGILIWAGFPHKETGETINGSALAFEFVLALLAILMSAFLFCLERIDEHPDIGKGLKDKRTRLLKAAMDGSSSTGIKTMDGA